VAEVDTIAFLADLHELRKIGEFRTGVHRPTYTPQDMESRRWLMNRMAEVGLEPEHRRHRQRARPPSGRGAAPARRQPHRDAERGGLAGWRAGCAGRPGAGAGMGLPVDVVAFADEEAHFGSFLGSRSMIGKVDEAEMDAAKHVQTGQPLREALKEAGLAGYPARAPGSLRATRASSSSTSSRVRSWRAPGCAAAW
jgi:N-carbamoyl-L-amino-acid hydrolase